MAEKIKGITIEIGGSTVGLNKALSATRKEINATQKELNEVDKALKLDPTNIDLVRQKQELLKKQITQTEDKVDALKKAKDQADRDMANGTEVNEEEYRKLVREISRGESALKELGTQADTVDDALKKAANGEEFDALGKNAEKAADKVEEIGESAEKTANGGFSVFKGAVANLVSNGISKLVDGCKNAISTLLNLGQETQEYREDIGKLETAFEAANQSTDLAKETYIEFYSVLGEEDRSVEAVNHLAKFVDTEKDMQKWTTICAGVWGTFGDSLPIEGLTEAANETAKVGTVTGVLADALNWAGVSEDGFNDKLSKCSTEQERSALITNTLNGLYSKAAERYRENNESIIEARKATSEYNDSLAQMGEAMEPLNTEITKIKSGIAEELAPQLEELQVQISEWIESDEGQQFLSDTATLIGDVLNGLISVIQWMAENKGIVTAIIVAITAVIIAYTVAQIAANAAIFACPITWIVTAIVALIATIVLLIMNWDKVAAVVKKVFDKVVSVIGQALGFIKQKCKDAVNFVIGVLNGILGGVEWIVNKIIDAVNWGIGKINSMLSGITDVLSFVGINVNWQIPSVPEISIPRIPLLAKGGTVFSGQAIVGEAGPELLTVNGGKTIVTPLSGNEKAQTAGMNVTVQIDQFNNYDTDTDINTLSDRVADKIAFKARRAVRC